MTSYPPNISMDSKYSGEEVPLSSSESSSSIPATTARNTQDNSANNSNNNIANNTTSPRINAPPIIAIPPRYNGDDYNRRGYRVSIRSPERTPLNLNSSSEENSPLLLVNTKGAIRYDHDSLRGGHHDIGDPLHFPKYRHTITSSDKEKMAAIESLDYVHVDNEMYRRYEKRRPARSRILDEFMRWLLVALIGIATGAVSYGIHISVSTIDYYKFGLILSLITESQNQAFYYFLLINCGLAFIAALAIVFEPSASGSGLPEVKGYLNGVRIPKAFNFRNMCATVVSVIFSVASSLPAGPEGPMIHIGGMIGGGLGEMRSRTLGFSLPLIPRFQNSRDRRDFISCGAACGVAAAFGAPIGGTLFALEEASSFWSQKLTWRTFFGTMMAVLTMSLGLSKFTGIMDMQADILFDITSTIDSYNIFAVFVPCVILGTVGGLSGGVFTYVNLKINKFRNKFINRRKWLRVIEVLLVTTLFSAAILYLPAIFPCVKLPENPTPDTNPESYSTNAYTCPKGYYNDFATLALTPQEQAVSRLIGVQEKRFSPASLVLFCVLYYAGSLITAGMGISTGVFVPMMIIGGSYGRAFGHLMNQWKAADIDLGIYGLIGAASFMSGVTRMTVSLVVILIEVTNDIQFLLPIILTVMISKAVGDYITLPLYDAQLAHKSIPFLEQEPVDAMTMMTCADIMAKDVVTFNAVEKVSVLLHALNMTNHNGFPVVAIGPQGDPKFKGIILRKQIMVLLKYSLYGSHSTTDLSRTTHTNFRNLLNGPRLGLSDIRITQMDLNGEVELWYYMNRSVIVVHPEMNLGIAFTLFRTMGLRHLPVVNDDNNVIGMITRKDLLHEVCEEKYHEMQDEEKEKEREWQHEKDPRFFAAM